MGRSHKVLLAVGLIAGGVFPAQTVAAQESCGSYNFAGPYTEAFLAGDPFGEAKQATETIVGMADAACHQDRVVDILSESLGPVVGYKAAATSAGAQKQIGLDGPVLGMVLDQMLLDDGASVTIDDGARLIFELDLMARVGSESLAQATTREQALAGIDAFIPFVELGDLMVAKGAPITGPLLQAMNAGARLGVVGEPVPVEGLDEDDLAAIAGTLTKDGKVVAEGTATALLGHPLDAVLWIAEAARGRNITLKPGDLMSLGSMGRFQLATPGEVVARYSGLGPNASVSVSLK